MIHGDWKPENTDFNRIYDFSDVRKGCELEDIMRYLTSSLISCSLRRLIQVKEAEYFVDRYIEYRAQIDIGFALNLQKQNELKRRAGDFHLFETSLYYLRSPKRDLRDPEKMRERRIYTHGLQQAILN